MSNRLSEQEINLELIFFLRGASTGDIFPARNLHHTLHACLTELELPGGQYWLTNGAKKVLAEMHFRLGECQGSGKELSDEVSKAVIMKPRRGGKPGIAKVFLNFVIAGCVVNELRRLETIKDHPSVTHAADNVAKRKRFKKEGDINRGEYLKARTIRGIYDKVMRDAPSFEEKFDLEALRIFFLPK